jgi:hypothetical protein
VIFWLVPLAFAVVLTSQAWGDCRGKRDHRLDVLGSLLVVLATVALMLTLALAPQPQFGWARDRARALAAGLALAPLIAWHLLRTPSP